MKYLIKILALALSLVFSLGAFAACTQNENKNDQKSSEPVTEPSSNQPSSNQPSDDVPTEDDSSYTFPENGVLKLMTDGKAVGTVDGRNPALVGDKIAIIFDFATKKAGLALSENTEITYSVVKGDGTKAEGVAKLENAFPELKNEYGYVGICFDPGVTLDKYESAKFDLSFKDESGKEYSVKNKSVFKGLSYLGLSAEDFRKVLGDDIKIAVNKQSVIQMASINGTNFVFNLGLSKWAGKTTPEQVIICAQTFWYCYPKMYARFGAAGNCPTQVALNIEDEGYEIASTGGSEVHLFDNWLHEHRIDFDCLTHEFGHVIQNGWDGEYCEYSGYIERFADYCRYVYALDKGKYNDQTWTLNTYGGENTRESSVRFLVWLDYFYSTPENDLVLKWFTICRSKRYRSSQWKSAWDEVFEDTDLQGKSIDEVFMMYAKSKFASLPSIGSNGVSPLTRQFKVREKLLREDA